MSLRRLSHVVPEADIAAAAEWVRRELRPGDVLVIDPPSQAEPHRLLGDLPAVLTLDPEPALLADYSRAFLLELDTLDKRGHAARILAAAGVAEAPTTFGAVRVIPHVLRRGPAVLWDGWRDLDGLSVTATYADGTTVPCDRWLGERWLCPRDAEWSWVGRHMVEDDAGRHACLWVHPLPRGGRLRLSLPPAATSGARAVRLGMGFTAHGQKNARAPVDLHLRAGDRQVSTTRHAPSANWTWQSLDLGDLGDQGDLDQTPLHLDLETYDNGAAHFCVALSVLGAPVQP